MGIAPAIISEKTRKQEVGLSDFTACWKLTYDERASQVEPQWVKNYKILRCKIKTDYPLHTKNFHGLTLANAVNIVSRQYAAIFSTQGVVYVPAGPLVSRERALELTKILNQDFLLWNFRREMLASLMDATFMGTGILKTLYEEQKKRDKILFEGNRTIHIPLEDFGIDPSASWDIQAASWVFQTKNTSIGYILAEAEAKEYDSEKIEELQKSISGTGAQASTLDSERVWNRRQGMSREGKFQEIMLSEGWFECGDHQEVLTAAKVGTADFILLKSENKNPYDHGEKPFHAFRQIAFPDEFYGFGMIPPSEGLQHEYNDLSNLEVEVAKQEACPMYIAPDTAEISSAQLKYVPGTIARGQDFDQIKPWIHAPRTQAIRFDREMIKSDLETIQGVNNALRGDPVQERTVGQTVIRVQRSVTRTNLDMEDIGNVLADISRQMLSNLEQFKPGGIQITDPELVEVQANCSLSPVKELRQQGLMGIYSLFAEDWNPAQKRIFQRVILQEGEVKEADEIIKAGEEPPMPALPPGLTPPVGLEIPGQGAIGGNPPELPVVPPGPVSILSPGGMQ